MIQKNKIVLYLAVLWYVHFMMLNIYIYIYIYIYTYLYHLNIYISLLIPCSLPFYTTIAFKSYIPPEKMFFISCLNIYILYCTTHAYKYCTCIVGLYDKSSLCNVM